MSDLRRYSICLAVSVDIDRFSDAYLSDIYAPMFEAAGHASDPASIRALCVSARADGLVCFPSCDNVDERGVCKGHRPEIDAEFARMRGEP
jgi:hypothetical protein